MTLLQERADKWGLGMIKVQEFNQHRRRIEESKWGCAEGWLQDETMSGLNVPCRDKLRGS